MADNGSADGTAGTDDPAVEGARTLAELFEEPAHLEGPGIPVPPPRVDRTSTIGETATGTDVDQ